MWILYFFFPGRKGWYHNEVKKQGIGCFNADAMAFPKVHGIQANASY